MAAGPTTPLLLACVHAARDELDKAAAAEPVFLSAAEKEALLRESAALEAQAVALRLRVMAVADDVAATSGARDVGAWWADRLRADFRAARSDLRVAQALEDRWPRLREALAAGRVSLDQTRVIVKALEALPDGLGDDERRRAEEVLLVEAARLSPSALRRLGAHLLEVLDPDGAEEALDRRLAAEEDRAARRTYLAITDQGDGTVAVRARLPRAAGIRLRTYLEAFTQPRITRLGTRRPTVAYERLLGQAFCQLLERYDAEALPHHGGDATTVLVTMTVDQLTARLASAAIGADGEISAAEARRLACNAAIIPVVLGGHGEVLDLGRQTRLFTPAQRKALRVRHRICAAEGCDVPATWCDAHHLEPWSTGGRSDLANGTLLCGHHHRLAHQPAYDHTRLANGELRFHRRT